MSEKENSSNNNNQESPSGKSPTLMKSKIKKPEPMKIENGGEAQNLKRKILRTIGIRVTRQHHLHALQKVVQMSTKG